MAREDLLAGIGRLPAADWTGLGWRHVATGRSPMSGEGARVVGGRWNPRGSFAVLYLGDRRETAVAEFLRLGNRQGLSPADFLPRTLYEYEIRLGAMLDLTAPDALDSLGVRREAVESDDLAVPQTIGEAAFTVGLEGVIAHSATGQGHVIAVFPERLRPNSYVRDTEAEIWESVPLD